LVWYQWRFLELVVALGGHFVSIAQSTRLGLTPQKSPWDQPGEELGFQIAKGVQLVRQEDSLACIGSMFLAWIGSQVRVPKYLSHQDSNPETSVGGFQGPMNPNYLSHQALATDFYAFEDEFQYQKSQVDSVYETRTDEEVEVQVHRDYN
jgi:hypothetical protein